jgi:protein-tyrosine phosphatase
MRFHARMLTRRQLLGGLVGAGALTSRLGEASERKTVLFVCTGNFYRSRFAQAVFNDRVHGSWTAVSRGLDVSTSQTLSVSPLVTAELARRGIDVHRVDGKPQRLTRKDLDAADVIVLLNGPEHTPMLRRQFPDFPLAKVRAWSVADASDLAPDAAFAEIWKQTDALLGELGAR